MPRFPYMNFPFPMYKNPQKPVSALYPTPKNTDIPQTAQIDSGKKNDEQKNKSNNNSSDYLFDLFGLKIYSDDVLLVSLIYFLYSEGVKDDGLFLVLLLLLLS